MTTPDRITVPDVWDEPATGTEWCDCGDHHDLDADRIRQMTATLYGHLPDHITHRGIIAVAAHVWSYVLVCEFFTGRIRDAAIDVNGSVEAQYPLDVGMSIVKRFSNRWNGCPMEDCAGDIVPTID